MPEPGRRVTESYRIAETLSLRVAGPAVFLMPFRAYFGPMRETDHARQAELQLSVYECTADNLPQPHRFEQTYKGADWRMGTASLDPRDMKVGVAAGVLGRVMVAQAGVGSLVRWMLGRGGFAWVHAAALVRDDRTLLLAGPSGVGKSQLVLRAVRDGWRYVTDDHALVHERGVSGLTTPILLRGYGGWPCGLKYPLKLRGRRALARAARCLSRGRIDPMFGYRPVEDVIRVSPRPFPSRTTVCLLAPGEVTAVHGRDASLLHETLFDQMRHAGRFLDQLAAAAQPPTAAALGLDAFWRDQARVLRSWLNHAETITATLTQPVDDAAYRSLFALLGLGRASEGGGRG